MKIFTGIISFLFFSGTIRRRLAILFLAGWLTNVPWMDLRNLARLVCWYQMVMLVISIPGLIRMKSYERRLSEITESRLPPDAKAELRAGLLEQFQKEQQKSFGWWERFKAKMNEKVDDL